MYPTPGTAIFPVTTFPSFSTALSMNSSVDGTSIVLVTDLRFSLRVIAPSIPGSPFSPVVINQ